MQQEIARLRQELGQLNGRVQQASVAAVTPEMEAALHKAFDSQLSDLRIQNDNQMGAVQSLYSEMSNYKRAINLRVAGLQTNVDGLAAAVGARSGGQQ